jgi:CheY-like chemotaxis protein
MKKIILVESDSHHIDIYRRVFSNTDFEVELARGREEMMEELRDIRNGNSREPDLVLLDFMLADGNGAEVLRAIKKSHFTKNIPVFAVTNYQNRDLEKELTASAIAPEKYFIKAHCTPAEIVDVAERYLGQKPPRPNRVKTSLA